jgi:ComF family protein
VSVLKQLVFTPKCAICKRLGVEFCLACVKNIEPFRGNDLLEVAPIFFAGEYSGWLRDSLISYKNGDHSQAKALSAALKQTIDSFIPRQALTLIPIPSSPQKIRDRGFDSMNKLCLSLVRERQWLELDISNLYIRRQVLDQVGLNAAQRQTNLAGAFGTRKIISGTVLLVDDVVTTGATLNSAARALRFAGAQRILAVALCGTPKVG